MGQKFLSSESLKPEDYFTYLRFSHISRTSKVIVLQSSKTPPFPGFPQIHHQLLYKGEKKEKKRKKKFRRFWKKTLQILTKNFIIKKYTKKIKKKRKFSKPCQKNENGQNPY